MSEDKERQVVEQTRRNHSELHAIAGNIRKIKVRAGKRIYGENEVRSPIKAIGILAATFLASLIFISIIYFISTLLGG
jgi:hypothetical protein